MKIHLLAHINRKDALEAAAQIGQWLFSKGIEAYADSETAERTPLNRVEDWDFADCDLVVVFGGDGSLIRAAHLCSTKGTPILGVYYGHFGFVTQCRPEEARAAINEFLEGRAKYDERMMLDVKLLRQDQVVATIHALNETVLSREATSRMMRFGVTVDNRLITEYPSDGVLIATPTGSTAYNLSVGGPVVDPAVQGIIVSAIAPHTLSARPLMLGPNSIIDLKVLAAGNAVLSVDGQSRLHLLSGDSVRVSRSDRITRLMMVEQDDFLIKLSERLLWSHGWTREENE